MIITDLPAGAIVHDPIFSDVVCWFGRTEGDPEREPDKFSDLASVLQIQVPGPGGAPYLFVGTESAPTILWGRGFAEAAMGRNGIPDTAVEARFLRDYQNVARDKSTASGRVVGDVAVDGISIRVEYDRFVFPLRFQAFNAVGVLARFRAPPTPLN